MRNTINFGKWKEAVINHTCDLITTNLTTSWISLCLVSYQTIPSTVKTDTLQTARVTESVPYLGGGRKEWRLSEDEKSSTRHKRENAKDFLVP